MRRVALFSLIALAFAACNQGPTALDSSSPRRIAGAAHFSTQNPSVCTILDNGRLRCSIDEAGLGNENVNYTLAADFDALFACINGGGKNPSAANKRVVQGDVTGGASLEVTNGRARGTIQTSVPSAGDFGCPGGQRLRFVAVEYSDIVLTDTTNDVSTFPTPDPICRSFFPSLADCPAPFEL